MDDKPESKKDPSHKKVYVKAELKRIPLDDEEGLLEYCRDKPFDAQGLKDFLKECYALREDRGRMNRSSTGKEKRTYPRVLITLPADFRMTDKLKVVPGLVRNVSEGGLLIQTFTDMPIGTKINIKVLFSKELEVANFRAIAEIVWKDSYLWKDWEGYQYGLKFIHMSNKDCLNLTLVLCGQSNLDSREARDEG